MFVRIGGGTQFWLHSIDADTGETAQSFESLGTGMASAQVHHQPGASARAVPEVGVMLLCQMLCVSHLIFINIRQINLLSWRPGCFGLLVEDENGHASLQPEEALFFPKQCCHTWVLTVRVQAWCSFEVVSMMGSKFDDSYSTNAP